MWRYDVRSKEAPGMQRLIVEATGDRGEQRKVNRYIATTLEKIMPVAVIPTRRLTLNRNTRRSFWWLRRKRKARNREEALVAAEHKISRRQHRTSRIPGDSPTITGHRSLPNSEENQRAVCLRGNWEINHSFRKFSLEPVAHDAIFRYGLVNLAI